MIKTLTAWVRANCVGAAVQNNLLTAAVRAENHRHDFHAAIGSPLTRSKNGYLVQSYGGQLSVFALTNEQIRHFGIRGAMTTFCEHHARPSIARSPVLVIEGFEIDNAGRQILFEPIRGRCRYTSQQPLPSGICLRVEMVLRMNTPSGATSRVALFCYPFFRPGAGSIDFQFTPARTEQPRSPAVPQTAALFLTACTIPDPNQGREALAISDALGTLVTFRPASQAAS